MLNLGKKGYLFGKKKIYPYATGGDYVYLYEEDGKTYRVHEFLSTGTSTLNVEVGGEMDILVVGGGGGGGGSSDGQPGGGGGAGGFLLLENRIILPKNYSISVGAGGTAGPRSTSGARGQSGTNSLFDSFEAIGGGGGGGHGYGSNDNIGGGRNGGSGGGGASTSQSFMRSAGNGTTGQGNNGGSGSWAGDAIGDISGGGGGADQAGFSGTDGRGGNGISFLNRYFSGGGGGAGRNSNQGKSGGLGGGGNGGNGSSGFAGTPNTGGGGGAGSGWGSGGSGGAGGSGIVIVRYVVAEKKLWTPSELGSSVAAWYDADDSSTITLNGSNVSQWSDKSGNGKHAIQNNSSLQPAYTTAGLNNRNVVTLTQDELAVTNLVLTGQGHEVYTIATLESSSNTYGRLFSFRTTGQTYDYNNTTSWLPVYRDTANAKLGAYQNSSSSTFYTTTYGTPMLISSTISNGLTVRVNGVVEGTKATSSDLNTTDGLKIGQSIQLSDENWDGFVAEIVFTEELSITDRQKLEGYLAHKWGLTNNLPSGHPYKYEPPYKVEPEEIVTDGLVLNLDAGDYASYPRSGTTWYDISGNGLNGTLTNGPTYNSANKGSIVFDGSNDYVDIPNISFTGEFTFSAWFRLSSLTTPSARMIFGEDSGSNLGGPKIGFSGSNYFLRIVSDSSSDITGPAIDTWTHMTATRDSQNKVDLYINGGSANRLFSDAAQSGTFVLDKIGANGSDAGQNFNGNISVVHAYNRALSSTEIQQNFNALRGRYGV